MHHRALLPRNIRISMHAAKRVDFCAYDRIVSRKDSTEPDRSSVCWERREEISRISPMLLDIALTRSAVWFTVEHIFAISAAISSVALLVSWERALTSAATTAKPLHGPLR